MFQELVFLVLIFFGFLIVYLFGKNVDYEKRIERLENELSKQKKKVKEAEKEAKQE